ncbi:hypothetical protein WN59_09470 [Salinicoccus sediminis]|uniref:ABC transporter permease n=1 Tax=Salinicoccus sediminis TaxID=1432562 RepID=A0A0M2SHU8_9STAP|nr:ABC transporter permease [Salinicoccus sediminis]KKK33833.1 hypothetical protein WN59_09470 [Salinicoccus sediminis]
MNNLLKAEMFKLGRNRAFWLILAISTGLSALMHYLIIVGWWMISGTSFDAVGLGGLNALSMFLVPAFFNLMIGTLAAFFISTEFGAGGVIKNQILSGRPRSEIYVSKYIVYTLGSVFIGVLIPLSTGLIMLAATGNLEILDGGNITYLIRMHLLFILQYAGYTAMITLLAVLTEDSGKTIIFSVLFTLLMFVVEKVPVFNIVEIIYDYSIFQQFNLVMAPRMSAGMMAEAVVVGVLTIVVVVAAGCMVFGRKEIK